MAKLEELLKKITIQGVESHIKSLEGIRHPVAAPEALERAFYYIKDNLHEWGYEMKEQLFVDDGREFKNILGIKQGFQEPEKIIIVIAHFDTVAISPGANDNASGVAAMLEMARAFRENRFRKSIFFIGVNQEEQRVDGLMDSPICRGSSALAAHAKENKWAIDGIIYFEEIAYGSDDIHQTVPENFPIEVSNIGNFIGIIGNANSAEMVKACGEGIDEYHIPLPYIPLVVPGNGEMVPDTRRSDHAPFWDLGYRAIMLTDTAEFRTPHYHKPSDTLETLHIPFATQVCKAGACLAFKMAEYEKSES